MNLVPEHAAPTNVPRAGDCSRVLSWRRLFLLGIVSAVGLGGWWGWKLGRAAFFRQACLAAKAAEDWPSMEEQAVCWSQVAPGSAAPFVYAAEAALAADAMDRAAGYLDQVPDHDPAAVAALLERVDMLFADLAEPLDAAATCQRILTIDSGCGPAHQRLTFFYAVTLQRSQLAAQARQAIERGCELPEAYVYLIGADWITLSNIVPVNQPWRAKHPDEELFCVAIARGEVAARGLEFSLAFEQAPDDRDGTASATARQLQTTFDRFPKNLELLAFFLEEAITVGDPNRVIDLLALVPAAGQQDNRFWRYKGWLHATRGEQSEAHEALTQAVALNPFDFAARHYLADLARKRGDVQQAEQLARLAEQGRRLRRTILQQPEVRAMPLPVMRQIADYAEACGQPEIADRLTVRIEQLRVSQPAAGPPLPPGMTRQKPAEKSG